MSIDADITFRSRVLAVYTGKQTRTEGAS